MKSPAWIGLFFIFSLGAGFGDSPARAADGLIVHEWGTFTSVSGSDGRLLSGLEREEDRLPNFVQCHAGFSPANKGWDRPVKNVTIKMETPVIYFYADHETPVTVDVRFKGGSISQWYPQRSGGEELPATPHPVTDIEQLRGMEPVDFSKPFAGAIQWKATVLAPGDPAKITAQADWETPQWPRARVADANRVRTPDGAVEGFLFYRGIGHFEVPLQVTVAADGTITLRNVGDTAIPYAVVYQQQSGSDPLTREITGLAPGEIREVPPLVVRKMRFHYALTSAGLTDAEASAMLATWKESYFERPGLRVFWIVPRTFTDRILPIAISPKPDKLARVLVGRSEVLAPSFEEELLRGFSADGGSRWLNDRYFAAYRERVRQLGVVLPANTP